MLGLVLGWVGGSLTVLGILLSIWFWLRPRPPKNSSAPSHEKLRVEVSNHIPVFDHPDGSQTCGDHLVAVVVRNGTATPVKATGWGLHLPGGRNIVVTTPTTSWESPLPHWVQPRDEATWYLDAGDLRRQSTELGCPYDDMVAFVNFADGREVTAATGVPLA